MKQLLVDLRNNGGGLLDQAIEVADQFLPEGSTIVETRGRTRDSFQSYQASGKYPALDLPVVVLVNEGTASAAEILSGAIQDHDAAWSSGTPSWGKGLVQTVYNLSYGAGLALTTAKYYTPSGRLIQRDYTSYFDYYTHADAGSPEITGKPVDRARDLPAPTSAARSTAAAASPRTSMVKDEELLALRAVPAGPQRLPQLRRRLHEPQQGAIKSPTGSPAPEVLDEFRALAGQGEDRHRRGGRRGLRRAGRPRLLAAPDPRRGAEHRLRPGGPPPRAVRRATSRSRPPWASSTAPPSCSPSAAQIGAQGGAGGDAGRRGCHATKALEPGCRCGHAK